MVPSASMADTAAARLHADELDEFGLLRELRRSTWVLLPAAAVLTAVSAWQPSRPMLLMTGLVWVVCALHGFARRAASANRDVPALAWQAAAIWCLALGVSFGGMRLLALTSVLALSPVIAAVPHLSSTNLLRMGVLAGLVTCAGAVVVWSGFSIPFVPDEIQRVLVSLGIVACLATCCHSLWRSSAALASSADEAADANQRLRASEALLEQNVEQRTRELERSRAATVKARDAALASNRHKSAFLANMSHELRTPLNAIIGFSEVLDEKVFGELNAKQAEYVTDIHESGHRLLALINDILDVSKIEAGRFELSTGPCDVRILVESAVVAHSEQARERGIDLVAEPSDELPVLTADERRMMQVIGNLLSNALKYTPEEGRVIVRARPHGDGVVVEVEDTGIGISERDLPHMFDAFRQAQVENIYSHANPGTGVGLALTRMLVELHGGRCEVDSEVGRGSTFSFTLPREPATALAKAGSA